MLVEVEAGSPESVEADVLAAPLLASATLAGPVAALNGRLGERLAELIEQGELSGKLQTAPLLHLDGELKAGRLAIPGLGAREALDADAVRTAAGTVVREARGFARSIAWLLDESLPLSAAEQARAIVDGTFLGSYDPGRWKSSPEAPRLELLTIVSSDAAARAAARRAAVVARWTKPARALANAPPNALTPERLAERAAEHGQTAGDVAVEAFGRDRIEELGMGAFAAVARAAHNDPRLIVMRYRPADAGGDVHLGLVGKAITFDSGGISLKPSLHMQNMKGDMAGGAAVIAAI